jgi:hypothetical protein
MEENASTITFSPYPANAAKAPSTEHQARTNQPGTKTGTQTKERKSNQQEKQYSTLLTSCRQDSSSLINSRLFWNVLCPPNSHY